MKLISAILLVASLCFGAEPKLKLNWSRLPSLPDTNGVAGAFAGVSGSALIVAGGANFPGAKPWEGGKKIWHDDVFVLTKPNGDWKTAGHLPRPLGYGVAVTYGDEIICVGGSDERQHYTDVFAASWNGRAISTRKLPSLPRPIANACGAISGKTLYLAGGLEAPTATNALSSFLSLDLNDSKAKWRELPSWPGPARMLATAAAHDGAFFLFGGVELFAGENGQPTRRYLRDAYRFDPRKGWRRLADLPFAIAAAPSPAPVVGDHIFVLSGDDGSRAALTPSPTHPGFNDSVLAYDAKHDTWTRVGTSPSPRVTTPAVEWQSRWIIPSGEVRPGVRSPEIWSVGIDQP